MSGGDIIFWTVTIVGMAAAILFIFDYGFQQYAWNKGVCKRSNLIWREIRRKRDAIIYADTSIITDPDANFLTVTYRSIDNADSI